MLSSNLVVIAALSTTVDFFLGVGMMLVKFVTLV